MDKKEKTNRLLRIKQHRFLIEETSKYVSEITDSGVFVECGVKHGGSSVIMSKVLSRKGYLFDTWTGFPHFSEEDVFSESWSERLRGRVKKKSDNYKSCINKLKKWDVFNNCDMIRGDICKTIPEFANSNKKEKGLNCLFT